MRRALATPWPWAGAGVALLVFLPNLLWQAANGFPTLEDLRNVARTGKNVVLGPGAFVLQQVLQQGPHLLPLWLGGLAWLLLARKGRYRALGSAFVVFFVLMFAMKAKAYYLTPIYPIAPRGGGRRPRRAARAAAPPRRPRVAPRRGGGATPSS